MTLAYSGPKLMEILDLNCYVWSYKYNSLYYSYSVFQDRCFLSYQICDQANDKNNN